MNGQQRHPESEVTEFGFFLDALVAYSWWRTRNGEANRD